LHAPLIDTNAAAKVIPPDRGGSPGYNKTCV
jgi:hypothetical protein